MYELLLGSCGTLLYTRNPKYKEIWVEGKLNKIRQTLKIIPMAKKY